MKINSTYTSLALSLSASFLICFLGNAAAESSFPETLLKLPSGITVSFAQIGFGIYGENYYSNNSTSEYQVNLVFAVERAVGEMPTSTREHYNLTRTAIRSVHDEAARGPVADTTKLCKQTWRASVAHLRTIDIYSEQLLNFITSREPVAFSAVIVFSEEKRVIGKENKTHFTMRDTISIMHDLRDGSCAAIDPQNFDYTQKK